MKTKNVFNKSKEFFSFSEICEAEGVYKACGVDRSRLVTFKSSNHPPSFVTIYVSGNMIEPAPQVTWGGSVFTKTNETVSMILNPAEKTEEPVITEIKNHRYFTHVRGFGDDAKYVVVCPDGSSYIITETGAIEKDYNFTLKECLRNVEKGDWVECTVV